MSGGEGFLGRWSRLKRDGEKAADAAPTSLVVEPAAPDAAETPPVVAEPPEAEFDVTTLPSIEDLTANSDFSQFLQKGVPEALKNAALRRMWTLDPILSAPDRFAEYAWDFNDPNAMIGFGPLEPGFDPSTMLRQIMERPSPSPLVTQPATPSPRFRNRISRIQKPRRKSRSPPSRVLVSRWSKVSRGKLSRRSQQASMMTSLVLAKRLKPLNFSQFGGGMAAPFQIMNDEYTCVP